MPFRWGMGELLGKSTALRKDWLLQDKRGTDVGSRAEEHPDRSKGAGMLPHLQRDLHVRKDK